MSKQVQIRRDTATNINATTPAQGELGYDITNRRLRAGNGTTAGGIIIPNAYDLQQHGFDYATAGGTANALTLTLAPALEAYNAGATIKFKAAANNTGASTINVNGLGAKNIYKKSGGTVGALAADDIINGGTYTATYDGTQFQLEAASPNIVLAIKQGDISTSTGTFSGSCGTQFNDAGTGSIAAYIGSVQTLPGGQYGFALESRYPVAGGYQTGWWFGNNANSYSSRAFPWEIQRPSSQTVMGQQRYINSSPPLDMGDGVAPGLFMFLMLNPDGDIVAHYAADAPPWLYNGPTDVTARRLCPKTGEKQRLVQRRSLAELMDGAKLEYEYETITNAMKMADMDFMPHPWAGSVPPGHTVVLIDPLDPRFEKLAAHQNCGGGDEIVKALYDGKIFADNEALTKRKGPQGVMQCGLRFKYSTK